MNKILLIILLAAPTACNCQTTDLSLHLKAGASYSHTSTSSSAIIETINGQKQTIEMAISGNMVYLVKDITGDNYNMEVQYKTLSMEMGMPNGKKKFSSEIKDSADVLSAILGGLKNKTFYITMSRTGKIEAVSGIDSLISNMLLQVPNLTVVQKEQVRDQLMKSYGEKAFRGNIEMVTAIFPDKPVATGSVWIINTQLKSGMEATMKTTYQFKGASGSTYLIHGDSKIETTDKDAYTSINGMPVKYNLTGSMVSDIKIDKETGWLIEYATNQQIAGSCEIKDNEKLPGGITFPMTITTSLLMTGK